jgi:hypothetical protein
MKKNAILYSAILFVLLLASACAPALGSTAELASGDEMEAIPVTGDSEALQEGVEADAPAEMEVPAEAMEAPALLMPAEPADPNRTLRDSDSSLRAWEKRTLGVDKFLESLYERPFTSREMVYQPELDIITTDFSFDDDFFYFTIRLFGPDENGTLSGVYGVEFDRSLNGRGDLAVLSENTGEAWSAQGVMVYEDASGEVGGPKPLIADAGFDGSGYDTPVGLAAERAAHARIDPQDENAVQIAVSRALLGDPEKFLWGAWSIGDFSTFGADMWDFNDRMGPGAAGSPLRDDSNYPIKELYSIDNTCRLPYGFPQSGGFPGMCKVGVPQEEPEKSGKPGFSCPPGYFEIDGVCYQIPR